MTEAEKTPNAEAGEVQKPVRRTVPAHDWRDDGLDTHKGEYWYKCAKCGASDWIASYGTKDQLMPRECRRPNP